MPSRSLYTYKFQFIKPSTGEIIFIDEMRYPETVDEFWNRFGAITDWLKDHPQRRCVITRQDSDKVIDLIHHTLG
jgi:hypothetical protein